MTKINHRADRKKRIDCRHRFDNGPVTQECINCGEDYVHFLCTELDSLKAKLKGAEEAIEKVDNEIGGMIIGISGKKTTIREWLKFDETLANIRDGKNG